MFGGFAPEPAGFFLVLFYALAVKITVRTPVFEHTELFLRGVGETTDVVNKEMYTFDKVRAEVVFKRFIVFGAAYTAPYRIYLQLATAKRTSKRSNGF